jgi:hypothetical protein
VLFRCCPRGFKLVEEGRVMRVGEIPVQLARAQQVVDQAPADAGGPWLTPPTRRTMG